MTGSTLNLTKRFYKATSSGPAPSGQGHVVLLDGRSLRTPAKAIFAVPTAALAALIAEEWEAQIEVIAPSSMPLTRLVNVAIDRMPLSRDVTIDEIVKYAESDLLLAHAEAPDGLIAAEQAAWDPILKWASESLGAQFIPAAGIFIDKQKQSALDIIAAEANALDDFRLTALAHLGACFGSSLLALALVKGRLSAAEAFAASRVDESWQESKWGVDFEAAERTERLRRDVEATARFLSALDG
jgi:chaperone required for assembly of F1-ATPase